MIIIAIGKQLLNLTTSILFQRDYDDHRVTFDLDENNRFNPYIGGSFDLNDATKLRDFLNEYIDEKKSKIDEPN